MLGVGDLIALPFALFVTLPAVYLAFLAAVTLRTRSAPPDLSHPGRLHFAILIPAHDEEILVGKTVASAFRLDYPRSRFNVHVVADNCTDATAVVARSLGACVHERHAPQRPGKGAALNWLVEQVARESRVIDAFVIVDADSELSSNLLRAMECRLRNGAEAAQALYLVDASDAPLSRMRKLALRLHNHVRPRAHTTLGGSSHLYGNGMCFVAWLLREHPWSETSVGEDGELFARLVNHGHRVALIEEAMVRSVMPRSFREARSQSVRWERGRFDHFGLYFGLIWKGVTSRDIVRLLGGLGVIVPPVSVVAAFSVLALALGLVLRSPSIGAVGLVAVVSLLFYVMRGAALEGVSTRSLLRIIVWAPLYAVWMIWVLAQAAHGADRGLWIRTPRGPGPRVEATHSRRIA